MGLIPLKLVAALRPADLHQSMPKTTPALLRAPAKPAPQGPSSTPATPIRPSRKISQVKATNSSFLPYGNDEWRNLLDDVKELFRNGRYKECSDRCVASLEQVRGPVSWPAIFVHASCIVLQRDWKILLLPIMAGYQIPWIIWPKINVTTRRKRVWQS